MEQFPERKRAKLLAQCLLDKIPSKLRKDEDRRLYGRGGFRYKPSSETQGRGQSGREKKRDESFQAKEPLGTDSLRTISKTSSGCWLLTGHKKYFVLLCPIGEQLLLSSFRELVHEGYCPATLARFVHQACVCKGNFYFLLS